MKYLNILLFLCLSWTTSIYAQVNYVNVGRAGTLQQILEQKGYMDSEGLVIAGELNGRDIAVLRALTGSKNYCDFDEAAGLPVVSQPRLKSIDIYDARIVKGGLPYSFGIFDPGSSITYVFTWPITDDDVLGREMFVPYSTTTIKDFVTPSSLKRIDMSAFHGCSLLQTVYISEGVESIGETCFHLCQSLRRVVLPSTLASIGKHAFAMNAVSGTMQIEQLYCNAAIPPVMADASECFTTETLENCEVYVPAGCGEAYRDSEWGAFTHIIEAENMEALFADMKPQHHDIPVDMVEEEQGPVNMVYMEEAGTLQQLLEEKGMTDSKKLIIGGKINGRDILYLRILAGLRSDFQRPDLSYISNNGFPDKPGTALLRLDLYDANIVGGGGPYLSPRHVTDKADFDKWLRTEDNVAGESMFEDVWRLKEIILPATVRELGDYLFFGSIELDGCYYIPEGVERIGVGVFAHCRELEEIVLPASVAEIGNTTFYDCRKLRTIYSLCTTPPVFNNGNPCFSASLLEEGRLVVPAGCAEAYRNAYGWGSFKNIVEADDIEALVAQYKPQHHDFSVPTAVAPVSSYNDGAGTQVFNLSGMRLTQPARVLNIIRTEDGKTRKVVK